MNRHFLFKIGCFHLQPLTILNNFLPLLFTMQHQKESCLKYFFEILWILWNKEQHAHMNHGYMCRLYCICVCVFVGGPLSVCATHAVPYGSGWMTILAHFSSLMVGLLPFTFIWLDNPGPWLRKGRFVLWLSKVITSIIVSLLLQL